MTGTLDCCARAAIGHAAAGAAQAGQLHQPRAVSCRTWGFPPPCAISAAKLDMPQPSCHGGAGKSLEHSWNCSELEPEGPAAGCSGSRLEAPNRRGVYRIGPSNIGLRLARCESGKGLLALMGGQLARAAELDAAILSALAALAGASPDQLALELGQSAQEGQHQPAGREPPQCLGSNYKPSYPLGATLACTRGRRLPGSRENWDIREP